MKTAFYFLSAMMILFAPRVTSGVRINEIRVDLPGDNDPDEYFELVGRPGQSLDGLSYLVIGDSSPTLTSLESDGVIETVIRLDGLTIPDSGFFLVAEPAFSIGDVDPHLRSPLNFEDRDNTTHVLVRGLVDGALWTDLDIDRPEDGVASVRVDDGILDRTPWSDVLDAVSLVADNDPGPGFSDWFYGESLGGADVGPDGNYARPAHIYRIEDGIGDWAIGTFGQSNLNSLDTPGASNVRIARCDFDADGACDSMDADLLTGVGNLVRGVEDDFEPKFDLQEDGRVDRRDLAAFLTHAAHENGFNSPYLLGDTDLDGDVDTYDFAELGNNWQTAEGMVWSRGDFDGNGAVNGYDFGEFGNNWQRRIGPRPLDGIATVVPEPATWLLGVVAAALFGVLRREKSFRI